MDSSHKEQRCRSIMMVWVGGQIEGPNTGRDVKQGLAMCAVVGAMCVLAPAVFATTRPEQLAQAGARACKTLPRSTTVQHACFALQRLTERGYTMVFQITQVIRNTWAIVSHDSRRLRQQYALAAYNYLRAFVGAGGFATGAAPVPYSPKLGRFYDDNAWLGEDLATMYAGTNLSVLLRAAEASFRFELTGRWRRSDRRDQHHYPGGIYWTTGRRVRTTCTEAGVIHLALLLYGETHAGHLYLHFAKHLYWWTRWALGTAKGTYNERIEPDGRVKGSAFLNCDAMMSSDGMMLAADTGDEKYVAQANQTRLATAHQYGLKAMERTDPAFDSIYLYNTQRSSRRTLGAYAQYIRTRLDLKTGLVSWRRGFDTFPSKGCVSSFPCRQEQLAQAGTVGALALANR